MGLLENSSDLSPLQIKRMRPVEFSAELVILLIEGPQDKKASVDLLRRIPVEISRSGSS